MSSSERANGGADPILDRKGKGHKTRTNAGQLFGRDPARFAEFSRRCRAELIANKNALGMTWAGAQGHKLSYRRWASD
jgi:hypothetical protein